MIGGLVEQRPVVGPEPREQRHVVRAGQDVDGVDLHQPEPLEHPPDMAPARPLRPRLGKALRRERDPARLREAEPGERLRRGWIHGRRGTDYSMPFAAKIARPAGLPRNWAKLLAGSPCAEPDTGDAA